MCADGFLPIVVEDEPPRSVPNGDGSENATVQYFNCCPPHDSSSEENDATRHCSDPINIPTDFETNNYESAESICDNQESRKYPRQLKIYGIEREWNWTVGTKTWTTRNDFFVCCDSETMSMKNFENGDENNSTTPINFLDDVECVPYINQVYQVAKVKNKIGRLSPMCCDVPEGDFFIPRTIGNGASTGRYECCKNGPASPPFVQDSAFNITMYTTLALFSIAAVLSTIVSIGLLIPFLIQLKNDRHRRGSSTMRLFVLKSLPFTNRGRSTLRRNRGNSGLGRASMASTKIQRTPRYSTYNLYVVYLALLDLTWELCTIGMYVRTINQNFNLDFYLMPVWPLCVDYKPFESQYLQTPWFIGNVSINAIISYQVLELLRSARNARRVNQPCPNTASLQAGAVYILVATSVPIFYFTYNSRHAIAYWISFCLLVMPPLSYVFYAAFKVYWESYLPPLNGATAKDKALRELALYFYRIIAVYMLTNMPASVLTVLASKDIYWSNMVYMWLMALQPILTASFILNKSDARKYILDLITLSYLFGNARKNKPLPIGEEDDPQTASTSQKKTIFVDDDDDNELDAESELIFSVLGFIPEGDETEES